MSEDLSPKVEARNETLRQRAKAGERAKRLAITDLCETVHGRRFLWDFLSEAHLFEPSYIQGSFDATAFREGERNVGSKLLSYLTTNFPSSYLLMTKENSPVSLPQENDDE